VLVVWIFLPGFCLNCRVAIFVSRERKTVRPSKSMMDDIHDLSSAPDSSVLGPVSAARDAGHNAVVVHIAGLAEVPARQWTQVLDEVARWVFLVCLRPERSGKRQRQSDTDRLKRPGCQNSWFHLVPPQARPHSLVRVGDTLIERDIKSPQNGPQKISKAIR